MGIVTEVISGEPFDRPLRVVERDEALLLAPPPPPLLKLLPAQLAPLGVFNFPAAYEPLHFAPPRGVFEGSTLRVEWQNMHGRQPFYHRNADVDEIGYQVCGERTLITECGTIEFATGQFARIPVGVAHDNFGREDIHLLFYLHGPAQPCATPVARGEHRVPPFAGWTGKPAVEVTTHNLGAPNGVLSYSMANEELILGAANRFTDAIEVLQPSGASSDIEWLYRAPKVWLGHTTLSGPAPRTYVRRMAADEIQYQAAGTRTIVSQRGVVTLNPGDFTCIPRGCAYSNVTDSESKHISLLTVEHVPPVREPNRTADISAADWLKTHGSAAKTTRNS